jgi:hypothetical protein
MVKEVLEKTVGKTVRQMDSNIQIFEILLIQCLGANRPGLLCLRSAYAGETCCLPNLWAAATVTRIATKDILR